MSQNYIEAFEKTRLAGTIAAGEYTFEIEILSDNDQILATDSKTIVIESPSSIELESPGSVSLSDTTNNLCK